MHKQLWFWIIFISVIISAGIFLVNGEEDYFKIEKTVIVFNNEKMKEGEFLKILEQMEENQTVEGEDNLSTEEEIKEMAIDFAKEQLLFSSFLNSKKIRVSSKEIEDFYTKTIEEDPSIESKEDLFSFLEKSGLTKKEVEKQVILTIKYEKLTEEYKEEVEISEEEVKESYQEYLDFIESMGEDVKEEVMPLEEIRGEIEDYLSREKIFLRIEEEIEEFKENSDVKIFI